MVCSCFVLASCFSLVVISFFSESWTTAPRRFTTFTSIPWHDLYQPKVDVVTVGAWVRLYGIRIRDGSHPLPALAATELGFVRGTVAVINPDPEPIGEVVAGGAMQRTVSEHGFGESIRSDYFLDL